MKQDRRKIVIDYITENQNNFYRYAYSHTGNRDFALDAVQNSVCAAITNCNSLKEPSAVRSWFYRILVNECMNIYRKGDKEIPFAPEDMTEGEYSDKYSFESEELLGRIEKLPHNLRTVVVLRFFEELSLKEISEATGENLSTVKTRLYTALARLKISLTEEDAVNERV